MKSVITEFKTSLDKKIDRFRELHFAGSESNPLVALALGEASFRRGLRLEALTAYQEVVKEHRVPEAFVAIAKIYAAQGMVSEAYDELVHAFELEPHNVEARVLGEELNELQPAPEFVLEQLARPPLYEAVQEASRRLQLEQKILERELQELTRNVALEPDEAIHEYLVAEMKKRLFRLTERLNQVNTMEATAQKTLAAPPMPSVDTVSPMGEEQPTTEESFGDTGTEEASIEATSSEETVSEATEYESLPPAFASENPLPIDEMFLTEDPLALSDLPMPKVDLEAGDALPPIPENLEPQLSESTEESLVEVEPASESEEVGATFEVPEESAPEVDPMPSEEFAAPEVETEPVAVDEPEPVAVDEPEQVAEVAEPAPEPQVSGPSPERLAFYESTSGQLAELTLALAKTRGVTSTFLVTREGSVLETSTEPEISPDRIGETVTEALDFLEAFAAGPQYWVLECNGGIFVMQTLDAHHVLVAVGQAGANFGALRYTMDKTRSKFVDILAALPV